MGRAPNGCGWVIEWLHTPCPALTIRRTSVGYAWACRPISENVACTPFAASRSSTLGVQVGSGPSSIVKATVFVRAFAPSTWPTRTAAGSGTDRVAPRRTIGSVDADGAAEAPATGTPVASPATAAALMTLAEIPQCCSAKFPTLGTRGIVGL